MSDICPPRDAVCENRAPSPPTDPTLPPSRPVSAGLKHIKTRGSWILFLSATSLFLWFMVAHPMLTCIGVGAFAGLVSSIADSNPAPSAPPSAPATPRERELQVELTRERKRAAAAGGGGLLCGLLLGWGFFDD